jgi:hypothetical protein
MSIQTESRLYSDNFRRKRRYLQGRGVNLRETIVVGSPYEDRAAGSRIAVPGLHTDDDIISVINMDDLVDVTGYLDLGSVAASLAVFSTNKGLVFTALQKGADGNLLYVKAAADPVASAPLSVTIGPYDAVLGTTGNGGKTVILVNLATNGSGVALTDGTNDAALVRAAILNAQQAMHGENFVDVALAGDGTTDWSATGPTAFTGGADFDQGPAAASVDTAIAGDNNDVRFTARAKGVDGNDITVDLNTGGAPGAAVAVSGTMPNIVVTVVATESTAQEVVDAVNAHAGASALVIATLAPGNDGTGIVAATSALPLVGGLDGGIQLTETSSGINLKVLWLTRDERDEN